MNKETSKRREAREWAVQFLFQQDYNPENINSALSSFWKDRNATDAAKQFTTELVHGVLENKAELDKIIKQNSSHWTPGRMSSVDKNIMRVAIFEMLYKHDIPPVVSINEAIEIAKKFGGAESGPFVNGLLDKAASKLDRSLRDVSE